MKREQLSRELFQLAAEVRLPLLDQVMLANNTATPDQLDKAGLRQLVALLAEHKQRTVAVVAAIRHRETVLARLCSHVPSYRDATPPLEIQAKTLRLVYILQQATMKVVDGIVRWRKMLTRPFGFMYEQQNYLLRIVRDSQAIEESSLARVLPLQTGAFPMCSNIPSLSMFTCSGVHEGAMVPLSNASASQTPQRVMQLKRCEAILSREFEAQLALYKELISLCVQGRFIPLLALPGVPDCKTGVCINSQKYTAKQAATLARCYEHLTSPPPLSQGVCFFISLFFLPFRPPTNVGE